MALVNTLGWMETKNKTQGSARLPEQNITWL
jgi:hypothetical protein